MADALSSDYKGDLVLGRLRIGTVQKALNLYLKTVWCMEPSWPTPPHCPVDRIILERAGINGSWTKLDSMSTYCEWIERLRKHASGNGFDSVAEWELCAWQS